MIMSKPCLDDALTIFKRSSLFPWSPICTFTSGKDNFVVVQSIYTKETADKTFSYLDVLLPISARICDQILKHVVPSESQGY